MCSRSLVPITVAVLFLAANLGAQPGGNDSKRFKMSSKGQLMLRVGGKDIPVLGSSVIEYTWKKDGQKRTLLVNSISAKASMGQKELMNATMSRDRFVIVEDGKTEETRYEDAPEELRKLLRSMFDTPVCTIQVDASGRELKRTLTVDPVASEIVDQEMVASATMFHAWYSGDKKEWQSEVEWGTGHGVAKGKLDYSKVNGGKDGQLVKVAGVLAAAGVKELGEITQTNAKFTIKGEQTYDPTRQEWISGKITADMTCQLTKGNKNIGSAKGTITVDFELIQSRK